MEKRKRNPDKYLTVKRSKISVETIIPLSNKKYIESEREQNGESKIVQITLFDGAYIEVVTNDPIKWSFDDCPDQYILRSLANDCPEKCIEYMTKYDHLIMFDPRTEVSYPQCWVCYNKSECKCIETFEMMLNKLGSRRCI